MGLSQFSYAGIGSRETPVEAIEEMKEIARSLAAKGFVLRSGGADGADMAFEIGCDEVSGPKEVFLPWKDFNKNKSHLFSVSNDALELAKTIHPAWANLSQGAQKLQARNCYQVLGSDLKSPASFVVCWTKDGIEDGAHRTSASGGTGQAIDLATKHQIKIFNLKNLNAKNRLFEYVDSLVSTSTKSNKKIF